MPPCSVFATGDWSKAGAATGARVDPAAATGALGATGAGAAGASSARAEGAIGETGAVGSTGCPNGSSGVAAWISLAIAKGWLPIARAANSLFALISSSAGELVGVLSCKLLIAFSALTISLCSRRAVCSKFSPALCPGCKVAAGAAEPIAPPITPPPRAPRPIA